MIHHIDLSTVLRRTVCDLYSNLVTRPTGAAVRTAIEMQLAELGGRTLTVIDFSNVNLLDYSCADEVVAKLLLPYCQEQPPREAYFVFRGVSECHLDALDAVLERHGLAIVLQLHDGAHQLVGAVGEEERTIWEALGRLGPAEAGELAEALAAERARVESLLDALCRRRLAMRLPPELYAAVGGNR